MIKVTRRRLVPPPPPEPIVLPPGDNVPFLVAGLKAEGYRFTTVSGLIDDYDGRHS